MKELDDTNKVDHTEEKLLKKALEQDTNLGDPAHKDLVDRIAYKYAGDKDTNHDADGLKLHEGEITKDNLNSILAPFQRIAKDPTFGVSFVEHAVDHNAPYEDIVAIDKLLSSMQSQEVILIQQEIEALKMIIQQPQGGETIGDFHEGQKAETRKVSDYIFQNKTLLEEFKKKPERAQQREDSESKRKAEVTEMFAGTQGIDADSINNISNELTMTRLEKTVKILENPPKDRSKDLIFDDSKLYADSMLEKTAIALKEIQQPKKVEDGTEEQPHTLSELPLFMIPGELRTFFEKYGEKPQPEFTDALKQAISTSADTVKDSKDTKTLEGEQSGPSMKTLEQMMVEKMPQLSQKEQQLIQNYVERVGLYKEEKGASNVTEGLKGFFKQLANIIKAIRSGFSEVRDEIKSDPETLEALKSLGIVSADRLSAIEEVELKKEGEMKPVDTKVSHALKNDLFGSGKPGSELAYIFQADSKLNAIQGETASSYLKLNKGKDTTIQGHIMDKILTVLDKDNAGELKKGLKDEVTGEWKSKEVNEKFADYKEYMTTTVWPTQFDKWSLLKEEHKNELITRSLAKNNSAAILYYRSIKDSLSKDTPSGSDINPMDEDPTTSDTSPTAKEEIKNTGDTENSGDTENTENPPVNTENPETPLDNPDSQENMTEKTQ